MFSLRNVSFKGIINYPDITIYGQVAFVCGESGCGKSTLLKLLNGTISADKGEISYLGKCLEDFDSIELRQNVLLCGQSSYLFDGNILDNFRQYYAYRGLPVPAGTEITELLKVCVADFPMDSLCASMSGGEQHRIFTAIYLSFRPKVLMLDEPTSALDDETANVMMTRLTAFCQKNNIALIIVSHNKAVIERFANQVITLDGGKRRE